MKLKELFKFSFDRCFSCDKHIPFGEGLCKSCMEKVSVYNSYKKCALCNRRLISSERVLCKYCDKLSPEFDGAIALYSYIDSFSEAFSEMKFRKKYYKVKSASKLMRLQFEKLNVKFDFIVPVPTILTNYLEREYCVSVELSHLIGKKCGLKVYDSLLIKKFSEQQAKLKFEERYENVKGAFSVNNLYKKKLDGKIVLLVDDVITSGATASECAKILKQNGAEYVYVIALLYGGEDRRERI